MKYLKLYEEFESSFDIDDKGNNMKISVGNSYIDFEYVKDTHFLVEFTDFDLEDVYNTIGDNCVHINEIFIDPEDKKDNPHLLRKFLNEVYRYAEEREAPVITLMAEPFGVKNKTVEELVSLYNNFGFVVYDIHNNHPLMFKDV